MSQNPQSPQSSSRDLPSDASPEQLESHFAIPDRVRFEAGPGHLTRALLTSDAASGHVYLHGAHVNHYQPAGGRDVMFVSERSAFAPGEPIRGGIPVCFPWFATHGDPPHGTVRLQPWHVTHTSARGGEATIELATTVEPFRVHYRVTVGPSLHVALTAQNTSREPATFELALHTYFAVSDARQIHITGLEGKQYLDKVQDFAELTQDGPIRIEQEVDRVYQHTHDTCTLHDPGYARQIVIEKSDAASTIVWNPWIDKAARLEDLADDDWQRFVCIESGNVHENAVTLEPGGSHESAARISVRPADA